MARSVSRIKLGYYPLSPAEGTRLCNLLDFEPGASAVDPCAGTGAALHQLTEGAEVEKHGVELDAGRAAQSAASGITTVHGNLFETIGKGESVSFLYLNPPYDFEIGSADNKRMEYLFLEHTFRWLVEGGVLLGLWINVSVAQDWINRLNSDWGVSSTQREGAQNLVLTAPSYGWRTAHTAVWADKNLRSQWWHFWSQSSGCIDRWNSQTNTLTGCL